MNFADIKRVDVANGPGVRVSLFVSGCTHHCEGCFNPETWNFDYGERFGQEQIDQILDLMDHSYIRGLSLLGGEPFEPQNQEGLLELVRQMKVRFPDKDLWCYSGYLYEKLAANQVGQHSRELLEQLDVLVDGRFVLAQKDLSLRFRGSRNQRIIRVQESLAQGEVVLWGEPQ